MPTTAQLQYSIYSLYSQFATKREEYELLMRDDVFVSALKRTLNNGRFDLIAGLSNDLAQKLNGYLENEDVRIQIEGIFATYDILVGDLRRTVLTNNLRIIVIVFSSAERASLASGTLLLLGYTGISYENDMEIPSSAVFAKSIPGLTKDKKGNWVNGPNASRMPTYTGTDIQIFAITPDMFTFLPTVKTISYSTHVDKTLVRVLGRSTAKGQSDGFRTVAGSMIHTMSVHDPLIPLHPEWFTNATEQIHNIQDLWKPYFATDQIPMFDLLIFFTNELGYSSAFTIFGIQIPDTGQVISMADSEIEISYTYTALDVDIMRGVQYHTSDTNAGGYTIDVVGQNEYITKRNRILNGYSLHTDPFEAPAMWKKIQDVYDEIDFMLTARYAKGVALPLFNRDTKKKTSNAILEENAKRLSERTQ